MRFRDFLLEKPMNMKTYSGVEKRLGNVAKVGFEFEMLVAEDAHFFVKAESDNRSTVRIDDLDTLDKIKDHFQVSSHDEHRVESDYNTWLDIQKEEWIDDHWEDYQDQDESEEDARAKAEETIDRQISWDNRFNFTKWLKNDFSSMAQFMRTYLLDPIWGWADENARYPTVYEDEPSGDEQDADLERTGEGMASSLRGIIKDEIEVVTSYHGKNKEIDKWYIEPDGSITNDTGLRAVGLELVSPPMPMTDALVMVARVFKWMNKNYIQTNASTGLHINVSIPNLKEKLDPVKLILFMGEKHALEEFNREKNSYTQSQIDVMLNRIKQSGGLPHTASDMIKRGWGIFSNSKNFSVNFNKLEKDYLEFRVAGGENYENDIERIKKTIYRFVTALEIATDTAAERQEYLKKFAALFAAGERLIQSAPSVGAFPKELTRLVKYNKNVIDYYDSFEDAMARDDNHVKKFTLFELMQRCVEIAAKFNTRLTLEERVYFKKLIKEVGISSSEVDAEFHNDHIARLKFKKEVGI